MTTNHTFRVCSCNDWLMFVIAIPYCRCSTDPHNLFRCYCNTVWKFIYLYLSPSNINEIKKWSLKRKNGALTMLWDPPSSKKRIGHSIILLFFVYSSRFITWVIFNTFISRWSKWPEHHVCNIEKSKRLNIQ